MQPLQQPYSIYACNINILYGIYGWYLLSFTCNCCGTLRWQLDAIHVKNTWCNQHHVNDWGSAIDGQADLSSTSRSFDLFPDSPNGYLPLRGVHTRTWPTPFNKPIPAWNKDVK